MDILLILICYCFISRRALSLNFSEAVVYLLLDFSTEIRLTLGESKIPLTKVPI